MLRSVFVALALAVAYSGATAPFAASDVSIRRGASALLGGPSTRALDGIISCGSAGNIRDVRFQGCTRTPCEAIVGQAYRLEVDFVPSRAYDLLSLAIDLFTHSGVEPILNGEIDNSAVVPGQQYTFGFTIRVTGEFLGPANILYRVYGEETMDEMCFIAGVNVEHPPRL